MLNPVFSMRHLSAMVPIFYEVTYKVGFIAVSTESELTYE